MALGKARNLGRARITGSRELREVAREVDPRRAGTVPSSKGVLEQAGNTSLGMA